MTANPAFSHPVALSDVLPRGKRVVIEADEAARAALAKQLRIPAVKRLTADSRFARSDGQGLRSRVGFEATVTQVCVVTAEAFDATVAEPIDISFVPEDEMPSEDEVGAEHESQLDAPDLLENDVVDLAAVVGEFLALSLDPYPRKPGAEFTPQDEAGAGDAPDGTYRPFAGLTNLVRRDRDDK